MSRENFLEDINLWKRVIKDGDRNAFSILYRKYYKPLLNYGLHLVPRRQLVKDSIQELFFTIWDKREGLSEVDNVSSYLYSSSRRTLFRQLKIHRTWQKRDYSYYKEASIENPLTTEQRLVVEECEKETKKNLQEAFANLNGHQKEAAFLKFYSGFSNDEISEIMGVKKESVYNYIYRAIFTLKESMDITPTG